MEKQALLELQAGGEGEKSSMIASSQKALSKAAQLVANATEMRKREARAVMDKIDRQIYCHLSTRLESLLPQSFVAPEIAAVKGELLASKVVGKAAQSLSAMSRLFASSIRPHIPDDTPSKMDGALSLSDDLKNELAATFHQAEFALEISQISSKFIRLLVAGQWPDHMSADASTELGSLLGHTLSELDVALGETLQSLKEEGRVTVEQSNIELLRQMAHNAIQSLESNLERKTGGLVSPDWTPPGLELMKNMSISKFSCLGAAASLSSVIHGSDRAVVVNSSLNKLYGKIEQCSSQVSSISLRLVNLDITNDKLVMEVEELISALTADSRVLLETVKDVLLSTGGAKPCEAAVDSSLRGLVKISAILRASKLNANEDGSYHAFSPEADDTWERLSGLARDVRAVDGDVDDVNYLLRARQVEQRLDLGIENEPKLESAVTKISSLEKVRFLVYSLIVAYLLLTSRISSQNLSSRSKEIAMQNARLSELERVLSKSNESSAVRGRSLDFKSSEEYNSLNEENRVVCRLSRLPSRKE
jgi:dynactin 1